MKEQEIEKRVDGPLVRKLSDLSWFLLFGFCREKSKEESGSVSPRGKFLFWRKEKKRG